jgi:hypothetical protein
MGLTSISTRMISTNVFRYFFVASAAHRLWGFYLPHVPTLP